MRRLIAIVTPILGGLAVYWMQTFFSAAAVVATPGCSNIDAALFGEITGVEVVADTLTAGHGCGTGPGQVYKYATTVSLPATGLSQSLNGDYIAGGVTDCFANATFTQLCSYPLPDASVGTTYAINVYAYDQAAWNQTLQLPDGGSTVTEVLSSNAASTTTSAAGVVFCSPLTGSSETVTTALATATWTTTCTADQQSTIPVLANCLPLDGGPSAPTAVSPHDDAGFDAGTDADIDAGQP